jgi:hypothetical protein
MNATRSNSIAQSPPFAVKFMSRLLLCCWLSLSAFSAKAAVITNVTAVNVTPSSFSVFWRAPASTTPSIEVFADAAGATNLAGQLGVEAFPLHTGNPDLAAGYERRLGRAALQRKTRDHDLMMIRVTGCSPNTTYYYRVKSTPASGASEVFPAASPLPAVTTPRENSFVVNHQQLIVDVTDLNTEGRVCLLTHTNAAYPLAAIVGDGVRTNQVFFDVNNLFEQAGGGNFSALGAQEFKVDVLGGDGSKLSQQFTLNFTASFAIAQTTLASFGTEFFAASVGSTIVLFGENGAVTINGNSSAGLGTISLSVDIPPGHLTNLTLQSLSAELNPATSTVSHEGGSSWRIQLAALPGQSFAGNKALANLAFLAGESPTSAFVPLKVTSVSAIKPGGGAVTQVVSTSGRVVVLGAEPLVEAARAQDGSRTLTLYGRPNLAYAIEYANVLSSADSWKLWTRVPMTAFTANLQPSQSIEPAAFYRAYEFKADPPLLEARAGAGGTRSLMLFGKPGTSYSLEYKTSLSPGSTWQSWNSLPLTNSFGAVNAPITADSQIFYRAR